MFFRGPAKVKCAAESLVTKSKRSVDDVFAITADSDESTVGGVDKRLGVDFASTEILGGEGDWLVVLNRGICLVSLIQY